MKNFQVNTSSRSITLEMVLYNVESRYYQNYRIFWYNHHTQQNQENRFNLFSLRWCSGWSDYAHSWWEELRKPPGRGCSRGTFASAGRYSTWLSVRHWPGSWRSLRSWGWRTSTRPGSSTSPAFRSSCSASWSISPSLLPVTCETFSPTSSCSMWLPPWRFVYFISCVYAFVALSLWAGLSACNSQELLWWDRSTVALMQFELLRLALNEIVWFEWHPLSVLFP